MSIKRHYLHPAITSSIKMSTPPPTSPLSLRALLIVLTMLLTLLFGLLSSSSSFAAESGLLGIDGGSEESTSNTLPDAFGRDTPRQTVQRFISALGENDYLLASNYLNLSKSDNPTTIVRQFKQALDTGGRFQPDLQISNVPEGNLTDQLPPNQERVGSISIDDKNVPLILERVVSDRGEQYWQFSSETIDSIPDVIENTNPTLVARYTVESLEDKSIFGYQLSDLVAAVVLIVSSFVLTYLFVWLCYHLLRIVYPRVRGVPLPLPNKVVVPLTLVIMSVFLTEIMVYAGVSVTLREPINRFTQIASWVAITWLLMRMVDAVSTRAVNLSYKKNYIERVSILGLLRKVVKALLIIFAVIVIFGNLGFDLTTGIAALGVGGLALALGAQKTIENLVGSVVVVADTPVRIGDYCKFGDQEGTVIDIGIRSSRVRTLNRTIVTVPNGGFSSMHIENFTSRDMFHFLHSLYIKRSADIEEIFRMVKDLDKLLNEHELTNQEWNQANILELRQDCYVIQLRAYVNCVDVIEFYGKQDTLLVDILTKVKKYKVEHALPTQQLIVNQGELEHELDNISEGEGSDFNDSEVIDNDNDEQNNESIELNKNVDVTDTIEEDKESDFKDKKAKLSLKKNHKKRSRALARRKFKRATKGFGLSIWNPPWDHFPKR
ncbi:mechanosensitive ion channel family protein [uncultured Psychrobacter sp.]|uniref:mechanosensitive ion channel family protein n=1 Tax=uncultured Psychrobacter sp. TaxID=259303 RepID=UPI00345A967E